MDLYLMNNRIFQYEGDVWGDCGVGNVDMNFYY